MELLGTAVRRVLQDARSRMDEVKTGAGGEARPGKVAPGGVARGKDHATPRGAGRMAMRNQTPQTGLRSQRSITGP